MQNLRSTAPDLAEAPAARTRLRPRRRLFLIAALILASNVWLLVARWDTIERAFPGGSGDSAVTASVDRFFDRYVTIDGRVVRRDQGGDTVSEGQAYAMLLAAAVGDRERFDRTWEWTQEYLQRDDGLLSWRWSSGSVAGSDPATDADLDVVRALVIGADRFDEASYRRDAGRVARAILRDLTTEIDGERVLLPGPWARDKDPTPINPSYFSPRTFELLASSDEEWSRVRSSSYRIVERLVSGPDRLPADWAMMSPDGVWPVFMPDDPAADPRFSLEAVRVLVRMAEDCAERGREIAAGARPFLVPDAGGELAFSYGLDGRPLDEGAHPIIVVGAAASAHAAGASEEAAELLDRAEEAEVRRSSYYGAAWVALGRVMLQSDLLGGCPLLS